MAVTSIVPHSKALRLFFFWTGIVATFTYRIIVILNHVSRPAATVAWYIGTVGFVIYFIHRFQISERRARLISTYDLPHKIGNLEGLGEPERAAMEYIFGTLQSSKEKWNYIFIFIMSGLALIGGVVLDIIRF